MRKTDTGPRLERDELGLSLVSCPWKAMIGVGQGKLGEQPSVGSEEQLGPLILSLLSARLSVQLASSFSQPFDVSPQEEGTW